MSWGYFAELHLELSEQAWAELGQRTPGSVTLAPGWSGLEEAHLESAFARPWGQDTTFAAILQTPAFRTPECVNRVEHQGGVAKLRVVILLDRLMLELAFPLACLLYAAAEHDARGALRLVNDGTYSGEEGVAVALEAGEISRAPIDDHESAIEELAGELFEALPGMAAGGPKINPFTGKLQG